ncbi:MAG: SDR family oxidoreductase [Spirulinaceae cyanobacterium]
MKITILGCGYVGKAVANKWNAAGHNLTVTTTTPEKVTELEKVAQKVVVLKGDDLPALTKLIADQETILFSIGAKKRTVAAYQEAYLNTAKNLVTALENSSTVKQLIYTGSYALYGDQKGEWIDETAPLVPENEYGQILAETEQVLLNTNLPVCIFRLGGIYGPGREIIKIFRSLAGTTRPGTGEDAANWIHLDDIVSALELARAKKLAGIYNLVNDVPLTKKQLLDKICNKHDLAPVSWSNSPDYTSPYNARLSNQKIKDAGLKLIHQETEV